MSKFVLLAFTLAGCGQPPPKPCPVCPPAAPPPAAPTGEWDPAMAAAQKDAVDEMFKALDAGNTDWFAKHMDADVVLFDTDADDKPVARRGKAAQEYIEKLTKDLKDGGGTIQTKTGHTDCHSTATVGFCAVEFKQVITMNGKAGEPKDYFGTTVMHKVGDDWKISHWHGGLGVETKEGGEDHPGKAPGGGDGEKGGKAGKAGKAGKSP